VKDVTTLRSGSLMIECFRKQQSLNFQHSNILMTSASPSRNTELSTAVVQSFVIKTRIYLN